MPRDEDVGIFEVPTDLPQGKTQISADGKQRLRAYNPISDAAEADALGRRIA